MNLKKELKSIAKPLLWFGLVMFYVEFLVLTAFLPCSLLFVLYSHLVDIGEIQLFWSSMVSFFIFLVLLSIVPIFIFRKYFKIVRKTDDDKNVSE